LHIDHAAFFGAVIFIGVAFCAPVCGFWYQRSDNKKVMLRSLTACACLLFTGILYLPMSISWIFPAMLLLGAFSCVYVLSFGLIPEVVPCHLRGAAVGLVNMGSMVIGAPILQPAIGWWLRRAPQNPEAILAHYQQSLCVLSIGLLIGLVLVSWLPVPRKQREENSFVDIMTRS
jgi:predicted MFS family arabinose efflux permease